LEVSGMSTLPPSPFLSSAPAETLPADYPGKDHVSAGSPALDQERIEAVEIEQILRALFARTE